MKKLCGFIVAGLCLVGPLTASAVLFDFDSAPLYTSLPIDLTVEGITAHFSACFYNYSIQRADVLGFTPVGFAGRCIYPNTVYLCDLYVAFSRPLTDFSIMYAPEEYGCDDSAIMRVTAYMGGTYVGTNTATADPPGTWPTGTLSFSSAQVFNSVVVHYDAPPACGDWGPIFMADNMNVTAAAVVLLGDLNCDGLVNNFDISPFVLALAATPPNYPEYYAQFPSCNRSLADINGDGRVDNFDITPFVHLLTGH
jgi:hypothetical protein